MIELLYGYFYSYERLRFTGLKIQDILNIAKENNVIIKNAVRVDYAVIEADVYKKHVKKLKSLLDENKYKVQTIKKQGSAYKLSANKKRIFLWILLPVMIIALYLLFSRTWQVKVIGAEDESIKNIAIENGMLDWRSNAINRIEDVEELILKSDNEILWCNISINGTVVEVYVKKNTFYKAEEPDSGNIVAEKDCIIRNLIVTSGTAKVKNGQNVSKGQMLIEATQKFGEEYFSVKAEGSAIASVWYYASKEVSLEKEFTEETGNYIAFYEINLFGKKVQSKNAKAFESYREVREQTENYFLPVKIEKVTRYETKTVTRTVDKLEAINEAEKEIINKLKLQIPEDAKVYETNTITEESEGTVKVGVYIETVENVAIRG